MNLLNIISDQQVRNRTCFCRNCFVSWVTFTSSLYEYFQAQLVLKR